MITGFVKNNIALILIAILILLVAGCTQRSPSESSPVHLVPDMDNQDKNKSQAESGFFEDLSTMRPLVDGTIARGQLKDDPAYYSGLNNRGSFIEKNPVPLNDNMSERGLQRYAIYCATCHGDDGNGSGMTVQKGMLPPPSFHIDRILAMPDGQIFDIITNGVKNMPSYKHQIPVDDRWAIILHFNELQKTFDGVINDPPKQFTQEAEEE